MPQFQTARSPIAIIGGGPAGLMAAETLALAGFSVTVYERMPTVGRKFLMAGRGGLNLTHSENLEHFLDRYGPARRWLEPLIRLFRPMLCANGPMTSERRLSSAAPDGYSPRL